MRMTKREKVLIIISSILIFGVLYVRFILMPLNNDMSVLNADYSSKKLLLFRAESKAVRMKAIENKIKELDKTDANMKNTLLIPVLVPEILDELDRAALDNKIEIDAIKFSGDLAAIKGAFKDSNQAAGTDAQKIENQVNAALGQNTAVPSPSPVPDNNVLSTNTVAQNLKSLTINLKFTCKYGDFMRFLKYYEGNQKLFIADVMDLKIDDKGKCTGELSLTTYSMQTGNPDLLNIVARDSVEIGRDIKLD